MKDKVMQNILRELIIRKDETNNLLRFAKYLENTPLQQIEKGLDITMVKTSIKANVVLMLYNAVESTLTKSLEKIHEKIGSEGLKYCDLCDELKLILAVYYEYSMEKSGNIHDKMRYVLQLSDFIKGDVCFNISYKELTRKYPLYSGNLDSKEIITVLKRYGINYEERCSELKTIKDDRNKLAHGEDSFEEIGRNLSIPQLEEMSDRAFSYLEKMIDRIEGYLKEEQYKSVVV